MFGKKNPTLPPSKTGGPVVKTGPTRGENRSRNDDGRWRAKRDDSGKSRGKKGCFLTTAACQYRGLPDNCHELQVLRQFRDKRLMPTAKGRALVRHYYAVAPTLAESLTDTELEQVWKSIQCCVALIARGSSGQAQRVYQRMVRGLLWARRSSHNVRLHRRDFSQWWRGPPGSQ